MGIKKIKAKAELHQRDTAARTNLRQQALTEIIKKGNTNTKLHRTETEIRIGNHRNPKIMSQQVDTDRGRQVKREGRGGRGYGGRGYRGRTSFVSKAFKSPIVEIASDNFNTGQIKFAAQFTQSKKKLPVTSNAALESKHIW